MGSQSTSIFADTSRYDYARWCSSVRRRRAYIGIAVVLLSLYIYLSAWPEFATRTKAWHSQSSKPHVDGIPSRIWQIYFGNTKIDALTPFLQTWILKNQDYAYTLMSNDGANAFAQKHYADRPEILQPFLELRSPILRTDLLRYMLLESEGGVYSDLDTSALKPVSDWVPKGMKTTVNAIIGIEYDQLEHEPYINMNERLQFCQWTIAARPGHHVMKTAVKDVVEALHTTAAQQHISIAEFDLADYDVVKVTGPVIWTKAVMKSISEATGTVIDYRNFTGMIQPRLFGDVLILPIDGFGTGQPHSNARQDDGGDAYIRHMFKGSWKHDWYN